MSNETSSKVFPVLSWISRLIWFHAGLMSAECLLKSLDYSIFWRMFFWRNWRHTFLQKSNFVATLNNQIGHKSILTLEKVNFFRIIWWKLQEIGIAKFLAFSYCDMEIVKVTWPLCDNMFLFPKVHPTIYFCFSLLTNKMYRKYVHFFPPR